MDVEKLIRERPELFDYSDVPRGTPAKAYSEALAKLMPQWMKARLAKSR